MARLGESGTIPIGFGVGRMLQAVVDLKPMLSKLPKLLKIFSLRFPWRAIAVACCAIAVTVGILLPAPGAIAALPSTTAIKDAKMLLRRSLPIDNPAVREVQETLEGMPKQANLKRWKALSDRIHDIIATVDTAPERFYGSVSDRNRSAAADALKEFRSTLDPLQDAIEARDRDSIKPLSEAALDKLDVLEALLVQGFPFQIPAAYNHLPRLLGRATVEMVTEKGTVVAILDGYSAPINAGQFADLVQRGFYNGLTFHRADDNYFLQAGDPPGEADGFVDPTTHTVRTVPMEIRLRNAVEPIYGHTLWEIGRDREQPILPFSVFGTLAMAHPSNDPNGGSSQFFLYLFESDLTPAGLNLIDGNYSAFGYVVDGQSVLDKLKLGDKILSMRLVSGAENLVVPSA